MYNVILRCVLATIVAVEKQCLLHIVCVCVCVCVFVFGLSYPAYNVHALYGHLWSVPPYNN